MIKIVTVAVVTALLVAGGSVAFARGGGPGGGHGASGFAPGQQFRTYGPVSGYPGASGYAPGRLYNGAGRQSLPGHPGASGYAPGHQFHHR
jgi:hypothetical protein